MSAVKTTRFGPPCWRTVESLMVLYDQLPQEAVDRTAFVRWWEQFPSRLPCVYCRISAREFLWGTLGHRRSRHLDPRYASLKKSSAAAQTLAFTLHQRVNHKLDHQDGGTDRKDSAPANLLEAVRQGRFQPWQTQDFLVHFFLMLWTLCQDVGPAREHHRRASTPNQLRQFLDLTVTLLSWEPSLDQDRSTPWATVVFAWRRHVKPAWPDNAEEDAAEACSRAVHRWYQVVWRTGRQHYEDWGEPWGWQETWQWCLDSRVGGGDCVKT